MNQNSTVYILGSGSSLLKLTEEEKEYLKNQTIIAMNKYILFWQKIGIFPTHYFLADIHYPAIKVFQESQSIIKKSGKDVYYLLDSSYKEAYWNKEYKGINNLQWFKRSSRQIFSYAIRKSFFYKPWIHIDKVTYFKRPHTFDTPIKWAKSLEEELFFYRGSLTILLNLLSILPLGKKIKLLGIDLNTSSSFYEEEIKTRPDLQDQWMKFQKNNSMNLHATAMPLNGQPGIQSQWEFINKQLHFSGRELFCCNIESLLIQDGLCQYAPILE